MTLSKDNKLGIDWNAIYRRIQISRSNTTTNIDSKDLIFEIWSSIFSGLFSNVEFFKIIEELK